MNRISVLFPAAAVIAVSTALAPLPAHAKLSCEAVLNKQTDLVSVDLIDYQAKETRWLFPFQVQMRNQETIRELKSLKIERRLPDRTPDITRADAQQMIDSIERNPVTRFEKYREYSPQGREIGFCFGRAMYTHLLGLKLGVQKESIKKAWVVGPMKNGGINWSFHVTTIMKSGDEWLAVDNFPGRLLTVEEWLRYMQPMSTDGKLRLYITDPDKFVGPYRYENVQLNHFGSYNGFLELPRDQDWYSGYFKDLLTWFHNPDLHSIGLPTPDEFKRAHMASVSPSNF